MGNDLYIVFAERTGKDDSGNYFYRLLFSDNPDVVWGDNFEQTPAGIIPDLEPDSSSINKEYVLTVKQMLSTAVESTWFSLQDCIDGIISLLFDGSGDKIVNIPFGMPLNQVEEYAEWLGGELNEVEYKPKNNITETNEEDGEES